MQPGNVWRHPWLAVISILASQLVGHGCNGAIQPGMKVPNPSVAATEQGTAARTHPGVVQYTAE